jgi:plasmid stabilization system protein ParE
VGYSIEVQSEALIELREAFKWYELQKAGLGYELLTMVERCYQKLSENPKYYSMINHRYRRIRTNPFPYFLIYEIEESRVIIISFFHVKRGGR